jgi:hypothetical protein
MPIFLNGSHFTLKMEAAQTSEMLVSYHNATWPHNPEELDLNTMNLLFFIKHRKYAERIRPTKLYLQKVPFPGFFLFTK